MEYFDGISLDKYLKKHSLSTKDIKEIMTQIIQGLEMNYVIGKNNEPVRFGHNNLSLENILIKTDENGKLSVKIINYEHASKVVFCIEEMDFLVSFWIGWIPRV